MKLSTPLVTLGIGAVVAAGLVAANVVNSARGADVAADAAPAAVTSPAPAPAASSAAVTPEASASPTPESLATTAPPTTAPPTTAPPTTAPPPTTEPAVEAPAITWTYAGPIDGTELTAAISVTGTEAVAYVCDGELIEFWLYGTATDGRLDLTSPTGEAIDAIATPQLVGGVFTSAAGSWTISAVSKAWPDWAPPAADGPGRA